MVAEMDISISYGLARVRFGENPSGSADPMFGRYQGCFGALKPLILRWTYISTLRSPLLSSIFRYPGGRTEQLRRENDGHVNEKPTQLNRKEFAVYFLMFGLLLCGSAN